MTGAARLLCMADLAEGQAVSESVAFTEDLLAVFVRLTGDTAPVHTDGDHAARLGFPNRLVHGMLVAAPYSRLLGMFLPGGNTVIHQIQLDMVGPVFVDDRIAYTVRVGRLLPSVRTVKLALSAEREDGAVVSRGYATCVFRA
jgi:3-hydroxybutyryl-CoA dehydratase